MRFSFLERGAPAAAVNQITRCWSALGGVRQGILRGTQEKQRRAILNEYSAYQWHVRTHLEAVARNTRKAEFWTRQVTS